MNNRIRVELEVDVPANYCAVNLVEHIAHLQYTLDSIPDEFKNNALLDLETYEDYDITCIKGEVSYYRDKTQLELQLEEEDSVKAIALADKQRLQQYKELQAEFGDIVEKSYEEGIER
tara:strand:+ start:1284 stop:1637 length:354 start_codon:yes stop_codon:yes gene_type:complete